MPARRHRGRGRIHAEHIGSSVGAGCSETGKTVSPLIDYEDLDAGDDLNGAPLLKLDSGDTSGEVSGLVSNTAPHEHNETAKDTQ